MIETEGPQSVYYGPVYISKFYKDTIAARRNA